jgi:hypothetical protein
MTADELRAELAKVGSRRTAAMAAKKRASTELAALIPEALDAGLRPSEITRLTGLSKQGLYNLTHPRQRRGD